MILRIATADYEWMQANPMVWFSPGARADYSRVAPGELAAETDADGELTGYVRMGHPNIDPFDARILEVILAGKAYAGALPKEDGDTLIYLRAVADMQAFQGLSYLVAAGQITRDQAVEKIRAEVERQAATLGLPPFVEETEDAEILEDVDPGGDDSGDPGDTPTSSDPVPDVRASDEDPAEGPRDGSLLSDVLADHLAGSSLGLSGSPFG